MGSPTWLLGFTECAGSLGYEVFFQGPLVVRLLVSFAGPIVYCLQGAVPCLWLWQDIILWGPLRVNKHVEFLCDNEAVVAVLKSGTSKDPNPMVLLHYLSLFAVHHSFSFTSLSVQGKANSVANTLSSSQFQHFRQLVPHADQEATVVAQYFLASFPVVWHSDSSCSSSRAWPFDSSGLPACSTKIYCLLQAGWSYWSWWPPTPTWWTNSDALLHNVGW